MAEQHAVTNVKKPTCKHCRWLFTNVDGSVEVLRNVAKDAETSPPEAPQNESAVGSLQPTAVAKDKTYLESLCDSCRKLFCCKKEEDEKPLVVNMQDLPKEAKDAETSPPGPSQNESAL